MYRARRRAIAGLLVLCVGGSLLAGGGRQVVVAAADTVASTSYHPPTVEGMSLRDAWVKLHPADGGPVVLVSGSPGSGPTELETLTNAAPTIAAALSPTMRAELSSARVGSQYSITVLTALNTGVVAPTLQTCISGCTACPDPNDCDYFYANLSGNTGFNSVTTSVNDEVDGYRDNGDSANWAFLNEGYTGVDQPGGDGTHDWTNSVQPCGQGVRFETVGTTQVAIYYDGMCGNGSWTPVSVCFLCISLFPPGIGAVKETISEDIYNTYCAEETEIFAGGGSATRDERAYWNVTEWPGGAYTYGNYGLNVGNC